MVLQILKAMLNHVEPKTDSHNAKFNDNVPF